MDPLELLGESLDGPRVAALVAESGERAEVSESPEGEPYLGLRRAGLALTADGTGIVTTVHLFSEGRDGFSAYRGELPGGLTMGDGRSAVRARLGPPSLRGWRRVLPFGASRPWDRYDQPDHSWHFEYSASGETIALATLMSAPVTPGREPAA